MSKLAIAPDIYWVGAVDWNMRNFHGYATHRGTTYNAYLIIDEKIALVDTVKAPFAEEMMQRIREVVSPEKIDFVISNHVEMDHSGALPRIMAEAHKAKLVTVERHGETGLGRTFHTPWPLMPVREGTQIELGKRKLSFIPTPMLHWPDSMVTYMEPEGILFSNDAFGQHLATSQRFDDEVDMAVVMQEVTTYYANILLPFPTQVARAVERVRAVGPRIIAPSHGIIWRTHQEQMLQAYARWSQGQTKKRAIVVYDTMWGSTEKMARSILEGIIGEGVEAHLYCLGQNPRSDIVTDLLESRGLVLGSPTINNWLFPTVAEFLAYIRGLRPRGRLGVAFGSYGWGGGATKAILEEMKQAGLEVVEPALNIKFVPDAADGEKCLQFGQEIARRINDGAAKVEGRPGA